MEQLYVFSVFLEITLDVDEFERITSTLINKLRDEELEYAAAVEQAQQQGQQAVESVITKDDLITWYLENNRDESVEQTDEFLQQEYEKISKVIDRMVLHDISLIVSSNKQKEN